MLLLAASPFAIRYATEARMYSLVMLLVFLGYLALRACSTGRRGVGCSCLAVVTGLLLYTHYWSFALLAVVGLWLVCPRGARHGRSSGARRGYAIGALGVGALTFVPWLPTFRYQEAHTGHAVGCGREPGEQHRRGGEVLRGQHARVGWALLFMVLLAVFARAIDQRHIEVDLWTRPGVRIEAGVGLATLGLGLLLARATATTFEGRYASVMFPLFLLAAGVRRHRLREPRRAVHGDRAAAGRWVLGWDEQRAAEPHAGLRDRERDQARRPPGRPRRLLPGLDRDRRQPAPALRTSTRSALPGFTHAGSHRLGRLHEAGRRDAPDRHRAGDRAARRDDHAIWFVYTSGHAGACRRSAG